jgi:hypothetical protein
LKKCLLLRTSFWAAIYLSTTPLGAYPGDHNGLDETQNPSPPSFTPPPSLVHPPSDNLLLDDGHRHEKWQAFLASSFVSNNPQRALLDTYEDSLSYCLLQENGKALLETLVSKCQRSFTSKLAKSLAIVPPNFLQDIHLKCIFYPPEERRAFFSSLAPSMLARCNTGFEIMRLASALWGLPSQDRLTMWQHIDDPLLSLCTNGLNVVSLVNAFALFQTHEERAQVRSFFTPSVLSLCQKKPRLQGKDLMPSVMAVAKVVTSFQKIPTTTQRQNVFNSFTQDFSSHCRHQRNLLTTLNSLIALSTVTERPLFQPSLLSQSTTPSDLSAFITFYSAVTERSQRKRISRILEDTFLMRCSDMQMLTTLSQMILEVDRLVPAHELSSFFSLSLMQNAQDLTQLSKYSIALAAVPSQEVRQEISDLITGPFSQCYPNPDDKVAYVRALGKMSPAVRAQAVQLTKDKYLLYAQDPTALKKLLHSLMKNASLRGITSVLASCDESLIIGRQTPETLSYLLSEFAALSPKRQRYASSLWKNHLSESHLCGVPLVETLVNYALTPGKRRRDHMKNLLTPRFVALCGNETGQVLHMLRPLPQEKRKTLAQFLKARPELLLDAKNNACTVPLLKELLRITQTCQDSSLFEVITLPLLAECQTYEDFQKLANALTKIPDQNERVSLSVLVTDLIHTHDLPEDIIDLVESFHKIKDPALRTEIHDEIKATILPFCQSAEDVASLVKVFSAVPDQEKRRHLYGLLRRDLLEGKSDVSIPDVTILFQYLATLEDEKRDALWTKVSTFLLPHEPSVPQICDVLLAITDLDETRQHTLLALLNKEIFESIPSDLGDFLEAIEASVPQDQWHTVPTFFTPKILKETQSLHDIDALVTALYEIESDSSRRQVMRYFHVISNKLKKNRADLIKALGSLESDEDRTEVFSYLTDAILNLHRYNGEALTLFIENVGSMHDKGLRQSVVKVFTESQARFCQTPQSAVMILQSLWKSAQRKQALRPDAPTQSHTQTE